MVKRKRKRKPLRNTDAQIFIEKVKLQKRQEKELERMDASFSRDDFDPNDCDRQFRFATRGL